MNNFQGLIGLQPRAKRSAPAVIPTDLSEKDINLDIPVTPNFVVKKNSILKNSRSGSKDFTGELQTPVKRGRLGVNLGASRENLKITIDEAGKVSKPNAILSGIAKPVLSLRNNRPNVRFAIENLPLSTKNTNEMKKLGNHIDRTNIQPTENIQFLTTFIQSKKRETISAMDVISNKDQIRERQREKLSKSVRQGFGMDRSMRTEWMKPRKDDTNWDSMKNSSQKCYLRWKATQPRSQSVDLGSDILNSSRHNQRNMSNIPKHLKYKKGVKNVDLLNERQVRDVLIPKFEKLGLAQVLKKKIAMVKFKETLQQVKDMHKIRTFYIPKTAFIKRKGQVHNFRGIENLSKIHEKNEENNLGDLSHSQMANHSPQSASVATKSLKETTNKTHFKITYKDCLIPDSMFESSAFQALVRISFLKNLPEVVINFYNHKKTPVNQIPMIAAWLGTIKGFEDMSIPFLKKIVIKLDKLEIKNTYIIEKDTLLKKMYILMDGQVKIFKDEKAEPLVKKIQILNQSLLYAVSPIPADHAVLVIGEAIFLELTLDDILDVKKSIRNQKSVNL